MRLRSVLFVSIAAAGVVAGARWTATFAVDHVERTSAGHVAEGLAAAGESWARADADGLTLILTGAAPDEAGRTRAVEILRRIVDPRRVVDRTTLAAADPPASPPFVLEMARNEREVTLIGLVPQAAGRRDVAASLAAEGFHGAVSDLVEVTAHSPPEGWETALAYGLEALGELPQATISVAPGRVTVTALAASEEERRETEAALREARPGGVALNLNVDAPRGVVDPFRVEFMMSGGTGSMAACAAETDADAAAIAAAAGASGSACAVGLGAPWRGWTPAAVAGIEAVRALGGGRFAMSGTEARLSGAPGAPMERLQAAGRALGDHLPDEVTLAVVAPAAEERGPDGAEVYAPRFDAVLAEGAVRLVGPVRDVSSREAIAAFAAAHFGHDRVVNDTVVDPNLPDGWPGRVLAGVEALSMMTEGRLEVTPEIVAIEGAAHAEAEARAAALFAEKDLGPSRIDVRVVAEEEARAADPVGDCLRALEAVQAERTIAFEPGSATLESEGEAALGAIAATFEGCPPLDLEVAGHTDARGGVEFNQRLSEERAATVKAALEAAGLHHLRLTARGYGAERPIADNGDEEGRARNRRIEFTLIADPADAGIAAAAGEAAAKYGQGAAGGPH